MDTIISVDPKPDKDKWILITTHTAPNYVSCQSGIEHLLVLYAEVIDQSAYEIEDYGFKYAPFEELASFYVADTHLTQHYLDDLLAFFLYESSWTGFNQEDLETTLSDWAVDEAGEDDKSIEDDLERTCEDADHDNNPKIRDQDQIFADDMYASECSEYYRKCRSIVFRKLKRILLS